MSAPSPDGTLTTAAFPLNERKSEFRASDRRIAPIAAGITSRFHADFSGSSDLPLTEFFASSPTSVEAQAHDSLALLQHD